MSESSKRVKVRASVLTGRVYALTEYAEDPETGLIVADVKHDVSDDVAVIAAEAVEKAWDEGARAAGGYGHEDDWTRDANPFLDNPYRIARTTTEETNE